MAKTANLYARIEPEVKDQAESILEALGVPVSNAISMFYKQIILQRGLPFEVKLPAPPVPDMSQLTKKELAFEISKGLADAESGHVTPADEVFASLREEFPV